MSSGNPMSDDRDRSYVITDGEVDELCAWHREQAVAAERERVTRIIRDMRDTRDEPAMVRHACTELLRRVEEQQ